MLNKDYLDSKQVLIVSPNKIDSLYDSLEIALGKSLAKKLLKDRQITLNGVDYFLEASKTKSSFVRGNIFIPWASQHTWGAALQDFRGENTFFIPWTGPDAPKMVPGGKDELALYLQSNPDSVEI